MADPGWFEALPKDVQERVVADYDAKERERVRAEWAANGEPEHDCDPLDTYLGGCSVCGAVIPDA